jgi:acetyl-CoA carboxylase alpha subunit
LFASLDLVLDAQLKELSAVPADTLVDGRYEKFRRMGKLGTEFLEAP